MVILVIIDFVTASHHGIFCISRGLQFCIFFIVYVKVVHRVEIFLIMLTKQLEHLQLQDQHTERELSGYIHCCLMPAADKRLYESKGKLFYLKYAHFQKYSITPSIYYAILPNIFSQVEIQISEHLYKIIGMKKQFRPGPRIQQKSLNFIHREKQLKFQCKNKLRYVMRLSQILYTECSELRQ